MYRSRLMLNSGRTKCFLCVSACASREKSIAGVATRKWIHLGFLLKCITMLAYTERLSLTNLVDTSGEIVDSGDPSLDGPVSNALEMIEKLATSERVEQVFIRHAFRFWMGRNETLHDRPVLLAAHKAYRESGGSMKALILYLVTSDAFIYRSQNY